MSRNADKTSAAGSIAESRDKKTDYRMFQQRGKSDQTWSSTEGARIENEQDMDNIHDSKTDLYRLSWKTDVQRGLIDDKWW
jgi:hypothetical protein